jgi:oxygen-independent coproporphyrinogen III oxidase
MAGIYFHIPFCKQACHYCDFHFSTNTTYKPELIRAIGREIELQQHYISDPVETIYFGGGTPSLLSGPELSFLLEKTFMYFQVNPGAEITLETNPDDLTPDALRTFREHGINRLSIGIQSFDDSILKYLHRAHNADSAENCVNMAHDAGFSNISIDLIYAIPGLSDELWAETIQKALMLKPVHISSYSLTIEEKTAFGRWAAQGKISPVADDNAAGQLSLLVSTLESAGFEQYEISNFALPGYYSRHNSSYWRQLPYLGVGPSAHSYNLKTRQSNISNNHLYMKSLAADQIPSTVEELSREDLINDYLLTTLRTSWGTSLKKLADEFGYDIRNSHSEYLGQLLTQGFAVINDSTLVLTRSGKFLADKISADLFAVAED